MNYFCLLSIIFVVFLQFSPSECIDLKALPKKIKNWALKTRTNLYDWLANLMHTNWRWEPSYVTNVSDHYREEKSVMAFVYGKNWFYPVYGPEPPKLVVPGGICPRLWLVKWSGVKLATQHNLTLNYWWQWPNSMIHIQLKTDYRYETNYMYFRKIQHAMADAGNKIMEEFYDPPKTLMEKWRVKFLQKFSSSYRKKKREEYTKENSVKKQPE